MKLTDLLTNQKLIVQLQWGEQKIEFNSDVVDHDEFSVYVSPYFHNGGVLELDVCGVGDVICNIFTDDPITKQRVSWKNVLLSTTKNNEGTVYQIKTHAFNSDSEHDDRRDNDRTIIQSYAKLYDGNSGKEVDIIVHDISNNGISFFAPASFVPKSQQLIVIFSDSVGDKQFDIKVECTISRIITKAGNTFVGCRINESNKDYILYGFSKRLVEKNRGKEVAITNMAS